MSIALDLSEVGAIATYSALIAEIRDMSDDAGYDQEAINRALRKVEAHLDRELRSPEMERATTLTAIGEFVALPNDFLDMRALRYSGSDAPDLIQTTPGALQFNYRGVSGSAAAYTIEGRSLRLAPIPTAATFDLLYFARIQPLTEAIQSNWVLDKHPDVYVAGALYHLARRERDGEGQGQAGTEYLAIIDAIIRNGISARWGAGPIVPQGMRQVNGCRA